MVNVGLFFRYTPVHAYSRCTNCARLTGVRIEGIFRSWHSPFVRLRRAACNAKEAKESKESGRRLEVAMGGEEVEPTSYRKLSRHVPGAGVDF